MDCVLRGKLLPGTAALTLDFYVINVNAMSIVAQSLRRLRFPGCSTVKQVIGDYCSDTVELIAERARNECESRSDVAYMTHSGNSGNLPVALLHNHHTVHHHPVTWKCAEKRVSTRLRGSLEIDGLFFTRRNNVRVSDDLV